MRNLALPVGVCEPHQGLERKVRVSVAVCNDGGPNARSKGSFLEGKTEAALMLDASASADDGIAFRIIARGRAGRVERLDRAALSPVTAASDALPDRST